LTCPEKSIVKPFDMFQLSFTAEILQPDVFHFRTIDSTNRFLLDDEQLADGSIAWADFQTAGRGRLQRAWQAPLADALLFSVVLRQRLELYPVQALAMATGLAVLESLQERFPDLSLALKWPNDVLIDDKKVCGILVESRTSGTQLTKVVIGIGINLNQGQDFFNSSPDLSRGTSLRLALGRMIQREPILDDVLRHLDTVLFQSQQDQGAQVLEHWKRYCPFFGSEIVLQSGEKQYRGFFRDISENGGIILEFADRHQIFYAGDVTVIKENGDAFSH
jgi:BirA family biotin operon repressor/biotin-[acetyl-CoA-carboxylase] ligase